MSRLPDGAQALWDEMQRESAPDVTELRATMHVARKSCYRCAACNSPILPGQRYCYQVLMVDGEFITHVTHRHGCSW